MENKNYELIENIINSTPLFINEMRETQLPICIYGMGDGAEKLLKVFSHYNIPYADFFASDDFVRGHSFHEKRVKSFSEIKETYTDFIIVVAFASSLPEIMERIKDMSSKHTLYVPDLPVVGENIFTREFAILHIDELTEAYSLMSDEQSRLVFTNTLKYKLSGNPEYLWDMETNKDEIFTNVLKPQENEIFFDLGAYRGDTIDELLHYTNNKYDKIYAFEPDTKTYKKLREHCINMENTELYNLAAWNKEEVLHFAKRAGRNSRLQSLSEFDIPPKKLVSINANSVDNILKGKPITYLKMDIEGAEYEGIIGARNTLSQYKPKLNIAGYHRSEDLFKLPLLIKKINTQYKVYMRHHPYFPAWDNNFYFI